MCHVAYANILPWTYNKAQGLLAVNHLASWTSLVLTSVCCVLSAMSFFSRLSPALFLSSLQGLSILLVWKPHKISVLKLKYCVWYKAGILYTQSPIGWWLVCLSSLVDARFHHWVMIGWWSLPLFLLLDLPLGLMEGKNKVTCWKFVPVRVWNFLGRKKYSFTFQGFSDWSKTQVDVRQIRKRKSNLTIYAQGIWTQ